MSLDRFDKIRSAIWQNKSAVISGCIWQDNWEQAPHGIIEKEGNSLFGHAIIFIGQKMINNQLYLVAQLSNGTDIGDKGLFYFSRSIINKFFIYGAYVFVDLNPEEVKKILWSPCLRFWEKVKKIYSVIWE